MEVSLIILTYNSSKYVESLLENLTTQYKEQIKDARLEIIIADNDSQDDTVKLAKKFKDVHVVENGGNYGYAKGNNLAAKKAKGKFLVFLNPDTKLESGNLFELLSEFNDEKVGIVGGRIVNFSGKEELSCGKLYTSSRVLLLSLGLEEKLGVRFSPKTRQEVDHVSGAFLVIRKSLFDTLHGFDEHYFMYIEDSDLCYRAKQEGYKVIFSPLVTIKHVGQGSSNRHFAIVNIYKGLSYFHKKHMGQSSYERVVSFLKMKAILLVMYGKISHNQYLVGTYEEALQAI